MSTIFEHAAGSGFVEKTSGRGTGTARGRVVAPLGINAEKVVAKRYSLKDENGEPLETWADIVRRVVGHVSKAETDPQKQADFYKQAGEILNQAAPYDWLWAVAHTDAYLDKLTPLIYPNARESFAQIEKWTLAP